MKIYALYKGDFCLGIGIVKELAKNHGVKERTIRFLTTPSYLKRVKGRKKQRKALICIQIGKE